MPSDRDERNAIDQIERDVARCNSRTSKEKLEKLEDQLNVLKLEPPGNPLRDKRSELSSRLLDLIDRKNEGERWKTGEKRWRIAFSVSVLFSILNLFFFIYQLITKTPCP